MNSLATGEQHHAPPSFQAQFSGPASPARRRRPSLSGYVFLAPAVIFVLLTVVYPLAYNILQSFFDVGLREVVQGGATWVGLDNYADQLGRSEFWHSVVISLIYAIGTVVLAYAGGLGLALLFSRPFRGRNVMRALLLVAWILPTVVSANVWRWLLDGSYGLLNAGLRVVGLLHRDLFWLGEPNTSVIAVIVATAWSFAPFAMILLTAGLQGISPTWYEAARIDGATPWQQFHYITLPLLRPVSMTATLLIFIFTFKTFDTIFLMTGGGPGGATETLPVYAYNEAFQFNRFDTASVATTILMIISTGFAVVYFRLLKSEDVG